MIMQLPTDDILIILPLLNKITIFGNRTFALICNIYQKLTYFVFLMFFFGFFSKFWSIKSVQWNLGLRT